MPHPETSEKKQRKAARRGLPLTAPVLFYLLAFTSFCVAVLTLVIGADFLPFTGGAWLLVLAALVVNDRFSFVRLGLMRPGDKRHSFSVLEEMVLIGLLILNLAATAFAIVTAEW